jgi:hypothetical protein
MRLMSTHIYSSIEEVLGLSVARVGLLHRLAIPLELINNIDIGNFQETSTAPTVPPYDTSNLSQTQTAASEVSQETINEIKQRLTKASITYLDVDHSYDLELNENEHHKGRRERKLEGHLEWCDSMNGTDPPEMINEVMRNIDAFVLKTRKIKLHKEAKDLFRSVLVKEKEMPEDILRQLEDGSFRAKHGVEAFRNLQEATKGRTVRELSKVYTLLHPERQEEVNEACRWLYRGKMIIERFISEFQYEERLCDPSTVDEEEAFYDTRNHFPCPDWT